MGTKNIVVSALACGIAALGGSAHAKPIEHIVFHEDTVVIVFDSTSPITCADGSPSTLSYHVTINGFEFTNRSIAQGDVRRSEADVALFQVNNCTGQFVFGLGELDNAFTQNGLQSASFQGAVPVADVFGTGAPLGTVTLSLSLAGTGPVSMDSQHLRFTVETPSGPAVETIHSNGKSENATVSGTISFNGAPVPLPTADLIFAQMGVSKSGTLELSTK